ncbi:transposable element Tcb1 transposase [Trichonephila clavipes]|uniref:Transposable element Tcb1 transposase n=1 Tax=Trichonephila clavipes TaxID=2585209 RepID=A0A8X6UYR1_TRICX|nr:transposable element Tcb1 transposase [Trichonephila clavipes]
MTDISAANGAMKEGRGWQNGIKLSLLTSHASVCNTTMISLSHLVRIAGTLNSQRYISEVLEPVVHPYLLDLATAIFQQGNARPHVARIVQRFFVNHQIELLPWPAGLSNLLPIGNMWFMVAQRLTQIIPQLPHQVNFGNVWKLLGLLNPKNSSKVSLNQCRGVWQW